VLFAMTVNMEGGADADLLVRGHPLTRDVAPSWIDALLLAAVANYLSLLAKPSSLPDTRAYQRTYVEATLRWVRRRAAG
jgi:hypothetical protein